MYQPPRTTIVLTFLYLSCAFALPTTPELPTDAPPSVFTHSTNIFGTRSIWNIIWSCFSTIFACTWIAVHPNIPGPKDSQWAVLCKRIAIMGCTLIVPEYIIGWEARQYWAARQLAKRHPEHGWTMAHGFFIGMGGFTLHDQRGTAVKVLEPEELEKLYSEGKVAWPSITEEEIQDRSKGDYLSKGIVLVQMSWFIIQCIVRAAYGLAITELEVATLAFAVLSGITYYLWWHKPLDVRHSVPVYLLPQLNQDPQLPISEEIQILQQSPIIPNKKFHLHLTTPLHPNPTAPCLYPKTTARTWYFLGSCLCIHPRYTLGILANRGGDDGRFNHTPLLFTTQRTHLLFSLGRREQQPSFPHLLPYLCSSCLRRNTLHCMVLQFSIPTRTVNVENFGGICFWGTHSLWVTHNYRQLSGSPPDYMCQGTLHFNHSHVLRRQNRAPYPSLYHTPSVASFGTHRYSVVIPFPSYKLIFQPTTTNFWDRHSLQ